jgi:hypothetical protein
MDWVTLIGGVVAGFAGGYTVKSVINVRRSTEITNSDVGTRTGSVTQRGNRAAKAGRRLPAAHTVIGYSFFTHQGTPARQLNAPVRRQPRQGLRMRRLVLALEGG